MRELFGNIVAQLNPTDFIDIALIAFIIYIVLRFIRETRAEQLVKGLVILVVFTIIAGVAQLYALNWLLRNFFQFGIIALVIVFQPELRRALEYLGRSKWFRGSFQSSDVSRAKNVASVITKAVDYFSTNQIGALIIIERNVALNDFAETGVTLNSDITPEIFETIFYSGAPLHDGAVIVSGAKIKAAACVLPLTRNKDLSLELGMRHRAAIGVTEVSDAYAIIVSEETGVISTAHDGKITRFLDVKALEKMLLDIYLKEKESFRKGIIRAFEMGDTDAK